MGMVFQAYSLFPNMTAARQRRRTGCGCAGWPAPSGAARADELLELVGLGDRRPGATRTSSPAGSSSAWRWPGRWPITPQVLLLDEPLSALDAKVRVQLRDEIRRVQREVGTTTLFVTHDQEEALAMADRVGVMRAGPAGADRAAGRAVRAAARPRSSPSSSG